MLQLLGPSSSRSRCQWCGARRAEHGVVHILVKGCCMRRGVGGGEGGEGEGEKAATAARGENGRRLREGGVLPY
jgi:hypothetical protein